MYKIWLSPPHLSGREENYINEALCDNWIAPGGPHVRAFEEELSAYHGGRPVVVLSSGTAALHLALNLAGIVKGDYVGCQTLTFIASANAILYQQAIPVFIDSEPESWNICPEALKTAIRRIGGKLKALIVVHLYGMPGQLNEIISLCRENGIVLIEDAAAALGSTYEGRKAGLFGDYAIFSFNGNKIITTSGGGALLSDDNRELSRARYLAAQAKLPGRSYNHAEMGFNYGLSNISAGIGRAQLEVLEARVSKRRLIFEVYKQVLGTFAPLRFQKEATQVLSNRWITACSLGGLHNGASLREVVLSHLEKVGIEARPVWKPMHLQPIFAKCNYIGGKVAADLSNDGICLPSGSQMTLEQQQFVCAHVQEVFESKVIRRTN